LEYCTGTGGVKLSADSAWSGSTGSGDTYRWYRSTTSGTAGFTEVQSSGVASYAGAEAGYWKVVVESASGCKDSMLTAIEVVENPLPGYVVPTAADSVLCVGEDLGLTGAGLGAGFTYKWLGPDGFISHSKDTTLTGVTTAAGGKYQVGAISAKGCQGPDSSIVIVVNPKPGMPTAGGTSSVCVGGAITLTGSSGIAGAAYSWGGPSGFVSTAQDTTVSDSATTAMGGDYKYVIIEHGCPSDTSTHTVKVDPLPVTSVITGKDTVCENESGVTYSVTNTTGSVYTWGVPGGATITSGGNSNSIEVTFGSVSDSIWVVEESPSGCLGDTVKLGVTVNPGVPVSVTLSDPGAICLGDTVNFTATPVNGGPNPVYAWYVDGVEITDSVRSSYIDTSLVNGSEVYVQLTSDTLCAVTNPASSNTITMTVTGVVTPEVTLSAPDTVCSGTSVTVTATGAGTGGSPTYEWFKNGISEGAASSSTSYTSSSLSNADTISVVLTSSSGCAVPPTDTSAGVVIYVDTPPAAAVITTPDPYNTCLDTVALSRAAVHAADSVRWSILSGPGTVDTAGVVRGLLSGQTTRVELSVSNGVCPSNTATIDIIRKTALTAPMAGINDTICETAASLTLNGNAPAIGETGTWYSLGGIAVTQAPGSPSATVTGPLAAGNYTFYYTMDNTLCTASDTVLIQVDADVVAPTAKDTITCADAIQLNASAISPVTAKGQWLISSGQGTIANPGDPESNLSDLLSTGTTELSWTVTNGVCPSKSVTIEVAKLGNVTTSTSELNGGAYTSKDVTNSSAKLCSGVSYTLSGASPAVGESGVWSIISGGELVDTSIKTTSYTFTPTSADTVVLKYEINRTGLTCPPSGSIVTLLINTPPAQPGTITGTNPVCAGSEDIYYSIPPVPGADDYTWSSSTTGVSVQSPGTGSGVLVNIGKAVSPSAEIEVVANNSCGSSPAQTISVPVNPLVIPTNTIAATTNPVCKYDSARFTSNVTSEGLNPGYQWYVNGNAISNADGGNKANPSFAPGLLQDGDQLTMELYPDQSCLDSDVLNANGAVESNSVTIHIIDPPTVSIAVSPTGTDICLGDAATFTAHVVQSTAGTISYAWSVNSISKGGNTDKYANVSDLQDKDTVRVTVSTTAACSLGPVSDEVVMTVHPLLPVNVSISVSPSDTICEGDTYPAFTANGVNGGSSPSYAWSIDTDPAGTDSPGYTPSGLAPGSHTVSVRLTSSERCTTPVSKEAVADTVLVIHPKPAAAITGDNQYCPGSSIDISGSPTGAGYSYVWYNGGTVLAETGPVLTVSSDGNYSIKVKTDKGCEEESSLHTVTQFGFKPTTISPSNADATKCTNQQMQLTAITGTANASYTWWHEGSVYSTGNPISVEDSGSYKVVLSVQLGTDECKDSTELKVMNIPEPGPKINEPGETICEGEQYTLTYEDDSSDGSGVNYVWYKAPEVQVGANAPYNARESGLYYVKASNKHCFSYSDSVEVVVESVPVAEAGPDKYILQGESAYLSGLGSSSKDPMTYKWWSDTYPKNVYEYNNMSDVLVYPDSVSTRFFLTVSSPSGKCLSTDSVDVHVELVVRAWNSLSPNGDGMYDTWIVENLESYPNALIEIYNRWGSLVWKATGYMQPWHGENFRNNEPLPVATYYYIIYPNGTRVNAPIAGAVTIVK